MTTLSHESKKAVELFNENRAKMILMSGGFSFHLKNTTRVNEADSMKEYAVSLGINAKSIVTERESTHTLANAYLCKKLFCEPRDWKDIVIVASSDHMPRVQYVFNKVFGPSYSLTYQKSRRVISLLRYAKEIIHEIGSMRLTKNWLNHIEDGDDKRILQVVLANRPNDTMGNLE